MSKNKPRNKIRDQSLKISPGRGVFYSQKKCDISAKLIWGSSEKNRRDAERALGQKLKQHIREHEKDKQLDLPTAGTPHGEQSQTIKRVSLRGEEK